MMFQVLLYSSAGDKVMFDKWTVLSCALTDTFELRDISWNSSYVLFGLHFPGELGSYLPVGDKRQARHHGAWWGSSLRVRPLSVLLPFSTPLEYFSQSLANCCFAFIVMCFTWRRSMRDGERIKKAKGLISLFNVRPEQSQMRDRSVGAVPSIKEPSRLWDFAEMLGLSDFSCC